MLTKTSFQFLPDPIPPSEILVSDVQTTQLELLWDASPGQSVERYTVSFINSNGDKVFVTTVLADDSSSVRVRLTDLFPGRQYSIVVDTVPESEERRTVQRTSKSSGRG